MRADGTKDTGTTRTTTTAIGATMIMGGGIAITTKGVVLRQIERSEWSFTLNRRHTSLLGTKIFPRCSLVSLTRLRSVEASRD